MTTLASYPGPYLTLEKHTKRKLNSEKIWTTNDQDRDNKKLQTRLRGNDEPAMG